LDKSLKFLFAYPVHAEANEHNKLHAHPFHELVVIQSGRFGARVAGNEYVAVPGDILLYTARTAHEDWAEDSGPVITWACGFHWDGFGPHEPVFRRDIQGKVQDLLSQLSPLHYRDKVLGASRHHDHDCLPILERMVTELQVLSPNGLASMAARVRTFIQSHMDQHLTVTQLAAQCGLRRSRFTHLYHAATGRTPREEIQVLRVEKARHLITTTTLPLHEIAPMVGIANEYHLSRLIRKYVGIGVRELRRTPASEPK